MTPEQERNVRLLKAVVVILGVLILLTLGAIIITISYRLANTGAEEPAATAAPAPISAPSPAAPPLATGVVDLNIDVRPGTLVGQVQLDGNRMVVQTTSPDGDQILIIDMNSGNLVGRVRLRESGQADE